MILASSSQSVTAFQQAGSALPIVFTAVIDPVAQGIVDNIARPGGNITGFANGEFSISAKWLELIKQIAPAVTRVAVIRDTAAQTTLGQFTTIQSAASSLGVEVTPIGMRDPSELERAIANFARAPNSGQISTAAPRLFSLSAMILPPITGCRLFIRFAISLLTAGWHPTGLICLTPTGVPLATSTVS